MAVAEEQSEGAPRHLSRSSLVVPIVATQRDIRFSLQLDSLAARMEAAEALLSDLRAEHEALLASQAAAVDDDGVPRTDGVWLGHGLVEAAIQLLQPAAGMSEPDQRG
ncbi:MAG: hypothetical protein QOF18_2801 [Frankiaceae bacterium]|jgi:hypothetical protein|nr:hypothetical protein [Frankiaceae bacterium]